MAPLAIKKGRERKNPVHAPSGSFKGTQPPAANCRSFSSFPFGILKEIFKNDHIPIHFSIVL